MITLSELTVEERIEKAVYVRLESPLVPGDFPETYDEVVGKLTRMLEPDYNQPRGPFHLVEVGPSDSEPDANLSETGVEDPELVLECVKTLPMHLLLETRNLMTWAQSPEDRTAVR